MIKDGTHICQKDLSNNRQCLVRVKMYCYYVFMVQIQHNFIQRKTDSQSKKSPLYQNKVQGVKPK